MLSKKKKIKKKTNALQLSKNNKYSIPTAITTSYFRPISTTSWLKHNISDRICKGKHIFQETPAKKNPKKKKKNPKNVTNKYGSEVLDFTASKLPHRQTHVTALKDMCYSLSRLLLEYYQKKLTTLFYENLFENMQKTTAEHAFIAYSCSVVQRCKDYYFLAAEQANYL